MNDDVNYSTAKGVKNITGCRDAYCRVENAGTNNDQYLKHVGYTDTNQGISAYFSDESVNFMTAKVCELLQARYGRRFAIPVDRIRDLANAIYESYRPSTGNIYTRYVMQTGENYNYVDEMINQVISVAMQNITDDLDQAVINSKLTIWSSLLGDFNRQGLRGYDELKIRRKRPQPMLINMNY